MKRFILVFGVFLSIVSPTFAQSELNNYSFVMVPEEYAFLSEKDQFQLNSMTKFLFDKNGFNSFYQTELPNVKLCDGLFAEIVEESNITRTTLFIILKDCNGFVIYEGEGSSRFKEYRKVYQDALRNAFKGIEKLNIRQKNIVIDTASLPTATPNDTRSDSVALEKKGQVPQKTFNQYVLDGVTYLLKKKEAGFTLFQESTLAENGLLFVAEISKENDDYSCLIDDKSYPVSFKSNKDLIIYKDESVMKLEFQN